MVDYRTPEREIGGSNLTRDVSLSKTLYSPKVHVIPRKQWLRPDMTEKLLTGTLGIEKQKQMKKINTFLFRNTTMV